MLRFCALAIGVVVLSGCATSPDGHAGTTNAICQRHAAERAQDAADNGYGANVRRKISDQVYADCLKWDRPVIAVHQTAN